MCLDRTIYHRLIFHCAHNDILLPDFKRACLGPVERHICLVQDSYRFCMLGKYVKVKHRPLLSQGILIVSGWIYLCYTSLES